METQLTLSIDNQTVSLANTFAQAKGVSLSQMVEYSLKWLMWNETFIKTPHIVDNLLQTKNQTTSQTKWDKLEQFLSENRFSLPVDYKFDREELYDR